MFILHTKTSIKKPRILAEPKLVSCPDIKSFARVWHTRESLYTSAVPRVFSKNHYYRLKKNVRHIGNCSRNQIITMSSEKSSDRLDQIVAQARRAAEQREQGYRAQALKMYPWICGRCAREFSRENLQELTVHHRDHDHDNNPADGSNWELLCVYCHDNEHSRYVDSSYGDIATDRQISATETHRPFADLAEKLRQKK